MGAVAACAGRRNGASTGPRPRGRGMLVEKESTPTVNFASTGPRPRGRGMMPPSRAMPISTMLQRGRARAGAECAGACINVAEKLFASTGPRPRGRGMRDTYSASTFSS